MLKTLFSNAKNSIIIYDKFFSVELLKALSEINNTLQVTVIFKQKKTQENPLLKLSYDVNKKRKHDIRKNLNVTYRT